VSEPLVSVIVPVHNGERYVREALDSVLCQTYQRVELVIVDDGSTDATGDVLSGFAADGRARVVRQEHTGVAAALNRGIELARGPLLAFLDSDDLWTADKLERQIDALDAEDSSALVFGWVREFHSPDLEDSERARIACPPGPAPGVSRGTMLCWSGTFERVGRFDSRWRIGEFIDWYMRALEVGFRRVMVEQVVMRRRLHTAHSSLREADRTDYVRILAAARRRRRGSHVGGLQ
jgi:glycosyltransferase involved in cell wall biosynthesis